jgi:serine-type D-Ala-D-Ala carboxypeptidase/endopeptidase (penicillin-binding protein 4)
MKKLLFPSLLFLLLSCSIQKKVANLTNSFILNDTAFANANVGISIYEPATNKYVYNHNGEKYFVPASNTKLLTCYAVMKYLGDSLVGLKYIENDTTLFIQGTGDPSFLMDEYKNQPVKEFLQKTIKKTIWNNTNWREEHWGYGWSWTDFTTDYSQERSALPISYNSIDFNNLIKIDKSKKESNKLVFNSTKEFENYFVNRIKVDGILNTNFTVERDVFDNIFTLKNSTKKNTNLVNFIPTNDLITIHLSALLNKQVQLNNNLVFLNLENKIKKIKSQPTDSNQ